LEEEAAQGRLPLIRPDDEALRMPFAANVEIAALINGEVINYKIGTPKDYVSAINLTFLT